MGLPVYIVNLAADTDRLAATMAQLQPYRFLDLYRIDAVRGRDIPDHACHILTGNAWSHENKGTLGCFLSHLKAWEFVARQDAPFALIVEDDVAFHNCEVLEDLVFPEDCDVLFCNASTAYPHPNPAVLTTRVRTMPLDPVPALVRQRGRSVGTYGYLLSQGGARKLLAFITADRLFSHVDLRLMAYCLDSTAGVHEATTEGVERMIYSLRNSYSPDHRLFGLVMIPSVAEAFDNSSARVTEDAAGQQHAPVRVAVL